MKQRYSDTSHDSHHRAHEPDKMRSESFPRPNHHPDNIILEHIARPYTGAISKLKLIDPKDTCSQDSGINLSFHETDERKKIRNSLERCVSLTVRTILEYKINFLVETDQHLPHLKKMKFN